MLAELAVLRARWPPAWGRRSRGLALAYCFPPIPPIPPNLPTDQDRSVGTPAKRNGWGTQHPTSPVPKSKGQGAPVTVSKGHQGRGRPAFDDALLCTGEQLYLSGVAGGVADAAKALRVKDCINPSRNAKKTSTA